MISPRIRTLLIVLLMVVGGIWVFYTIRQRAYTAAVTIDAAPLSATITIDGHHSHQGISRLKPGTVTVAIAHKGFTTVTKKVVVAVGDTQYIGEILKSNTPETADWYQQHPEDQKMVEKITSRQFDSVSSQLIKQQPLIKELPFIAAGLEFKIDYATPSGSTTPTIVIQADTQTARDDALTWIRSKGYDPSTMRIVYTTSDGTNGGD